MPERTDYVYGGSGNESARTLKAACPECGGKPRLQVGSAHLGICQGCRALLVLHNGRWSS